MAQSSKSRRERAEQARASVQVGQARRERTVRIVGAVVVVGVVVGIIGVAVYARSSAPAAPGLVTAEPDPNAALPAGVLPATDTRPFGVVYGNAPEGAPTLELWEDFQCPACGALEAVNGAGIAQLAEEGKYAAWGCAIDAGRVREYHDVIYANQPQEEGKGFTKEQLIAFGSDAGVPQDQMETFTQCVESGQYLTWAANSTQEFYNNEVSATPTGKLNGAEVPPEILADQAKLTDYVSKNAG
jgi:protein-disulfide isomerase